MGKLGDRSSASRRTWTSCSLYTAGGRYRAAAGANSFRQLLSQRLIGVLGRRTAGASCTGAMRACGLSARDRSPSASTRWRTLVRAVEWERAYVKARVVNDWPRPMRSIAIIRPFVYRRYLVTACSVRCAR